MLRAVKILRDEGLVFTVKRRGSYVTNRQVSIGAMSASMLRMGSQRFF